MKREEEGRGGQGREAAQPEAPAGACPTCFLLLLPVSDPVNLASCSCAQKPTPSAPHPVLPGTSGVGGATTHHVVASSDETRNQN